MAHRSSLRRIPRTPPGALSTAALAVALALLPGAGHAANWFAEVGISSSLTATDNANFDAAGSRESDIIFVLSPTLALRGEGRRLRVNGSLALSGVTYFNGSQDSSFAPTGVIAANLEAIERWFFVDASVSATRSIDNPLAPRPEGVSSFNRLNTTTTRVSPYIEREFPGDIRLRLRSDNTWTDTSGGSLPREAAYAARHSLSLSREPRPFGWALEASRTDERSESGVDQVPAVDIARLRLRYAFDGQFAAGLRGGYERSRLFLDNQTVSFVGAELAWRPSERTRFEGFWEDRSFGSGWQASFTHRSPFVAWDVRGSRDLTSFAESFIELPATGDLAALLDSALRTRIADPIERARAVEDFISQRGLPRSLPGPINVFSDQVVVRTAQTATITLIGTRSTLALTGYSQRDETPIGSTFVVLTGPATQLRQTGAALAYSLRLSALATATASAGWSRTRDATGASVPGGLPAGATSGETRQRTYRVQFDYRIAPRTTGFVGGRHQQSDSDVVVDSRENAVFAGLAHRF
jgi:uncharacterized protein (PEP-CTERM system associated)